MHLAGAVTAQDDRFLAHPRDEVIPRLRDLALMANKQPYPREQPLQLLLVDLLVDEDLAADLPRRHIDEPRAISFTRCSHGVLPDPGSRLRGGRPGPMAEIGTGLRRCDK